MRVLVTGASGLLGAAVARAVQQQGHTVRTFQRRSSGISGAEDALGSIARPADVAAAADGIDAVVHLAAKVSLTGDPAEFAAVNVAGTEALVTAAREVGARRFVLVSSPSVAHTGASIVGDGARPADPERARGHYARTKALAERLVLDADAEGFATVAVRPHLVWGPGDTQLVARIVERARSGRLPLLGHGAALIDSTYIDNAASAIVAALERADDVHGRAYVVTNGEPRPVAELIAGMCGAAGVSPPKWRVPASVAHAVGAIVEGVWGVRSGRDEPPMTRFLAEQLSTAHWFDQRTTRAELRWQPSVSIDEGFDALAVWYSSGSRASTMTDPSC